jgi:superoxide dismutase, Cu-Zn family
MNKIGMSLACLLVACGGSSSKRPTQPAPAPARAEAPATTETHRMPHDTHDTHGDEIAGDEAIDEQDTVLASGRGVTEPAEAGRLIATADVKAIKDGSSIGTLRFERWSDGTVEITGQFSGLKKKGIHALYIHENGDCSNKAKKVGGHLNPTKAKHGPPSSSVRHAGDFGNLVADEAGDATFSMTTDSITLDGDRGDSVLNRAVVVHSGKDNMKGSAGAPLACGVIQLEE